LIDCQIFAYCKLPDSDVIRLGNAALKNPRGTTGVTTQIAIFLAQYYIDKVGDGDLAILTLKNALERNPVSTALHLSAGRVYRVVGDFSRAESHLAEAARLVSGGTYRIEIAEEQQKLKRDYEKSRK
jgi:Flp pilus assembly protein TadD